MLEGGELIGVLGVVYKEGGDVFFVEYIEEFVDVRVEDGFVD